MGRPDPCNAIETRSVLSIGQPEIMRTLTVAWRRALVLSLIAGAACRAAAKPIPAAIEIPFRWTPGQIEVQVSIQGRSPIWCVLDSGAEFSMLDATVAKELEIGPIVRRGDRERVENASVRIGPLTLTRQAFTLWALDNFRRQKRDIRGVIGCDLFERYVVTVDFQKQRVILNVPRPYRPPPAAHRVPITFAGRLPVIAAALTVRGKRIPAKLMIDTGASQALVLRHPFATAQQLITRGDETRTSDTVATGRRPFITIPVDQLDLDRWTFKSPETSAYASPAGAGGYTESDGLLGNDILQHFRVTFDYSRKQVIFEER
jgi:aspartyl protease